MHRPPARSAQAGQSSHIKATGDRGELLCQIREGDQRPSGAELETHCSVPTSPGHVQGDRGPGWCRKLLQMTEEQTVTELRRNLGATGPQALKLFHPIRPTLVSTGWHELFAPFIKDNVSQPWLHD